MSGSKDENEVFVSMHQLKEMGNIISESKDSVELKREFFVKIFLQYVRLIRFNSDYYAKLYPDVVNSVGSPDPDALHEHYMNFGFYEGRLPCPITVDGSFYANLYPDIAKAITERRIPSAQIHFEKIGFREGRIPRKGWTILDILKKQRT